MTMMKQKITPSLDEQKGNLLDIPYGGLFGDEVIVHVVEELIADPHSPYTAKGLTELLKVSEQKGSEPRVRTALRSLANIGMLRVEGKKPEIYFVNMDNQRFIALNLLAYAVLDDIEGSNSLNTAIANYSIENLGLVERSTKIHIQASPPERISLNITGDQKNLMGFAHGMTSSIATSFQRARA